MIIVVVLAVAPPLSIDVVMGALESLSDKWRYVGKEILHIPDSVLDSVELEHSSDAERLRAGVRYWLLRDPLASWRKLVYMLDWEDEDAYRAVAAKLRSNTEKPSG